MKAIPLILIAIIAALFWPALSEPKTVVYSNDTPLGVVTKQAYREAVTGDWNDLNHLGSKGSTQGGGPAQIGSIAGLVGGGTVVLWVGALFLAAYTFNLRWLGFSMLLLTAIIPVIAIYGLQTKNELLAIQFSSISCIIFIFALMYGIGSLPVET